VTTRYIGGTLTEEGKLDFSEASGVLIVPVRKNPPAIILKNFSTNFYYEEDGKDENGANRKVIIWDYEVFWKDQSYGRTIPPTVKRQYYEGFWDTCFDDCGKYNILELPDGMVEFPLYYLEETNRFNLIGSKYITPVRRTLRKFGIFDESRGKGRKRDPIIKKRDNIVISKYRKLDNKKRLPIKEMEDEWADEMNLLFKDDPEKAANYYLTGRIIRGVIRRYTKK